MSITRTTVFQADDPGFHSQDFLTTEDREYLETYPGRTVTRIDSEDRRTRTVNVTFDSQEIMEQFDADERVIDILEQVSSSYRNIGVTVTTSMS